MVSFDTAVKLFFSNYANFNGRATRAEYWWVALFLFICYIVLYGIGYAIGGETGMSILVGIFGLAVLVPNLALTWRRLHDVGKGGGWYFISLIPVVGTIWLLVLTLTDSERGANRFGPAPGNEVKY